MQQVLTLFGKDKDTPVSYGQPIFLEPMSAFPLQWLIETDEFFQAQDLPDSDMPLSVDQSDQLIAKILRESPVAVAVAVTGPATNLAIVLVVFLLQDRIMVMVQITYTTGVSFVIFIVVVFVNRLNREVE